MHLIDAQRIALHACSSVLSTLLILNASKIYLHIHLLLQRRKYAAIEFDNKLLLERLAKIVQKKTVDNEVHESVRLHSKLKKKIAGTQKRLVMQKITEENHRLLRRIQEVPPAYNHLIWEEEAREREAIMKQMCLYPEFYEKQEKEKADKRRSLRVAKSGAVGVSFPPINHSR